VEDLLRRNRHFNDAEIVRRPPFTALSAVSELLSSVANVRLARKHA